MNIAASQNIKERDYWLNKLAGSPVKSFFPYDRKETTGDKRRFAAVNFQLRGELFSNLMHLSNNSDNRLHMIFAAGLAILLHKYTGNHDIIIGMPVLKQEAEGNFINRVLPLRNKLEPGMTFKQLLLQVKQTIFEAAEHQNYPMEALLYKLNIPSQGGFALFDAAVLLENIHDKNYLKPTNYNILFSFLRTAETTAGTLEYNSSLYEKTTIQRIARHFQRLFQVVFSDLDMRLADIDMLPEEEKRQLLVDFNNTHAAYPTDKTIHKLLEEQVEKTPCKTAVIYKDQYLTYGALNEKANRLARLLREKGVKPEKIVGILLEPSLEMILAIVGIIKAGGAYLPIDPGYPAKRISSIYKDSSASILLTREKTIHNIAVHEKDPDVLYAPDTLNVLLFDQVWQDLGRYSEVNPAHVNQPGDLLYLISTSGSTGTPKSFMMEHRNLVNLFYFEFLDTPVEFKRVLLFASIGFDVSVQEVFSPLLSGGELYLIDSEMKQDVYRLLELMQKNYLNVLFCPPAFLKYIFSEPDYRAGFPRSMEHIIAAGEQLIITEPIRRYIKENHIYLHNHYGPGETHLVTTFVIDPTGGIPELVPIGKPISNSRVYILDESKNIKPIGIYGELYISGVNVGRGYLNSPELTAKKFRRTVISHLSFVISSSESVTNDQCPMTNDRFYRTGDLSRWLPDGNIEFLGRVDHQVKIRGFRIEPGEIETRLLSHDKVREAVVVLKGEEFASQPYLCAYVVAEDDYEVSRLREYLARELPDYMVPPHIVAIDRIPLNPNGKIDWQALPSPEFEAPEHDEAPGNPVEEKLAEIWADILGIEKEAIGARRNFFELGGHSLKAASVTAKTREEFAVDMPLVEIFRSPTIKQLARYFQENEAECFLTVDRHLVLLKKQNRDARHLFLVHDGSGEVEGYSEFCRYLNADFNCWGIRAYADRNENYGPENLTIEDTTAKYIEKIKKLQPAGPYFIAGWSIGGAIAFEIVNQLEQKGEEVGFLALIDSPPPRQANAAIDVQRFSLDTEKKFISRYLSRQEIEKIPGNVKSIHDFWAYITAYLETDHFDIQSIRQVVMEYEAHVVPNYHGLEARQLVKYLNIGRTFQNARAMYTPARKIHTPVHYFAARQSEGIIIKNHWNDHCREVKTYEIPGDHYSIFRQPEVFHFVESFGKALE